MSNEVLNKSKCGHICVSAAAYGKRRDALFIMYVALYVARSHERYIPQNAINPSSARITNCNRLRIGKDGVVRKICTTRDKNVGCNRNVNKHTENYNIHFCGFQG